MLNCNYSFLCNIEILKKLATLSNDNTFKEIVDNYLKRYNTNFQVDINWLLISTSLLMSENMFKNSSSYNLISEKAIDEIAYRLKEFKGLLPIFKADLPGLLDSNNCPANPFYEFLDKSDEEDGWFYIDEDKTMRTNDSWESIKYYENIYIQKEKYYNSKKIDGPFGCNDSIMSNGLIDIRLLIKKIRNAIAHSNYEIINNDCIRLYNYKANKKLDFNITLDKNTIITVVDILNEIAYKKFTDFENYCKFDSFVDKGNFDEPLNNDSELINFIMSFEICDINMAKSLLMKAKDSLVENNITYDNYNIYSSICYVMYNYLKPCCEFGSIINNYMYTTSSGYIISDEFYNKYGIYNYLRADIYKSNYANKKENDYKENELKLLIFSYLNCCLLTTHNEMDNNNISFPKIDFMCMKIQNEILIKFIEKHRNSNLILLKTNKQKIDKIDKTIDSKMEFINNSREILKNNTINNDYFNFVLPKKIADCESEIRCLIQKKDKLLEENKEIMKKGINYKYYEELSDFIFRSLRNSLAHGYVNIIGNLTESFSDIELLFEDYDPDNNQLTFSGKIKFVDLLNCLLKNEVINNLYGHCNISLYNVNNSNKSR